MYVTIICVCLAEHRTEDFYIGLSQCHVTLFCKTSVFIHPSPNQYSNYELFILPRLV